MASKRLKLVFLFGLLASALTGCTKQDNGEKLPAWVDYVNSGEICLNHDYQGKDFYVDGIGQMELKTHIDGDTVHFTPLVDSLGKGTLKSRFYGIDTPESTGKVEEYGQEASNFTKEKIKQAAENGTIVVSSTSFEYEAPETDSTGSRYLSMVWINPTVKNAPYDTLVLLNLWIVQEGLSWVKSLDKFPAYKETFLAAEEQARTYKLNLFSGQPSSYFNYGDFQTVSLLDIKREIAKEIADPEYVNAYNNVNVRFTGTVAGYADHTLYIQECYYIDEEHPELGKEYAGINVFTGMTEISSKFKTVNTYVEICGLAQSSSTFGFQITNTQGRYTAYPPEKAEEGEDGYDDYQYWLQNDCKVLLKASENIEEHSLYTFEYSCDELSDIAKEQNLESLYCSVKLTDEFEFNRAYFNDDDEGTLYVKGQEFNIYIPYQYSPDGGGTTWNDWSFFEGKKFTLNNGVYAYHKTTSGNIVFQIIPAYTNGLVPVEE